jgi:5-methyltetrahydrofolate--homocysteine methyltransferase
MAFDLSQYVGEPKISDGAWGTQLASAGLPAGACTESWNLDNPSAVEAVARSYVDAGSDLILTNTFGANRFLLDRHGLGRQVEDICREGAAISRRAAGDDVKVFGSIGPTGKIVMTGDVDPEELEEAFFVAARGLLAGGADAIVLETFNELDEITAALSGAKRAGGLPVVASMTFSHGADQSRTMMGNSPADLVALARRGGASAVGANCGVGPANYVAIAAALHAAAGGMPVWIKPNAGVPRLGPGGKTVFPMGPDEFAAFADKLLAAGANILGGCCGTTPEHIRTLCKVVRGS